MMNHHLPAMPHGQPPMPPPRRQQDIPYTTGPPTMRSPPGYMGYHPHMNGHPPPGYSPQQYWYPTYPQMHMAPRPYQNPYGPMIVSSYPHAQPIMAPAHIPPHSLPLQPRASTPLQPTMSPIIPTHAPIEMPEHPPATVPVHPTPSPAVSSPAPTVTKPAPPPAPREPFRAPLPWLSVPDHPFPARAPRRRRRNRLQSSSVAVELPSKEDPRHAHVEKQESAAPAPSEPQTPTLSAAPSDANSTQQTTPASAAQKPSTSTQSQSQPKGSKPAAPVVPVVPVVPQAPATTRQPTKEEAGGSETTNPAGIEVKQDAAPDDTAKPDAGTAEEPAKPAAPKSWADLVRAKNSAKAASSSSAPSAGSNGVIVPKNESLAHVLTSLGENVSQFSDKVAFLEPRGLVNTGNMCYMNSVLQILVSCVPFYQFLDHVGRRAAHSFQSDVPLIDAMIMFMKEFRVIDAAHSEEQLKLRLKPNELEQYGDSFIPEFVYQVIRQLPRFRDMRRGHQQDAQEFLGFLLEEMHEECIRSAKTTESQSATAHEPADGWMEVGHKQKPAVTRASGDISQESPITKILGGKLRSEFRVPGNKNSVTLEPYQSLQLDIGSHDVHNIVDALRGLTKSENIQGDFNSARGPNVTATKQVFIESLPPVLILHLKRFQYDSVTHGTQKIWKKIGYPLDLEIPREVFPPNKRNVMMAQGGLPKYRLVGVIYHHGKNASGGHYTVDVRRQDGSEWIRLDDTVIRRVRSEDVAEAGGEEDPKVLAAALEQHKRDNNQNSNIFDHIDQDALDHADEGGWSQVNGTGASGHSSKKSFSAAANGASVPSSSKPSSGVRTPLGRYGSRDNRVAYLLFYQQIV